jgi:hypothetical protein
VSVTFEEGVEMLSGSLRKHLTEHNWFAVIVDLLVVVTGILVAFQIQNWAEEQKINRLELEYLSRLIEDFQVEIGNMDSALEYAESRIEAVMFLDSVLADSAVATESPELLPWAIETATWRSFPAINSFVYSELQSSGNLALIRSESLRNGLAAHYTTLNHYSRVGLDLQAQHQFELYTAGILTVDELVAVENGDWGSETITVELERAWEIEVTFRERKEAIALLPSLIQHHTFNKKVISESRDRARKIIKQIESLISSL